MKRNRIHYLLLIVLTIAIGLFSRNDSVPAWIYPYLGDILYATMFFFIVGFLFPKLSILRVGLLSVGICYLIEFSQFYQADWINTIRSYRLGGLVLGFGFLWSDLVSYTIGGVVGMLLEWYRYRKLNEV